MLKICAPFLLMLTVFAGCASVVSQVTLPVMEGQMAAIQEEGDLELARQAIPGQLKMLEGMLKADAQNVVLMDRLAEGFCSYAFSFVEDESPARAADLYGRGRDYAQRALRERTGGAWQDGTPEQLAQALKALRKDAMPSLFWYGQCWGGWLLLNLTKVSALADIPRVSAVMEQALEWDPAFHYAGPHAFLGGFYGGRSRMLGGLPEKARQHFESAIRLTERKFLLNQFLFAKFFAVQAQDRDLFQRLLKEVIDGSPDLLPEQRLANAVARHKATILIGRMDDLF